MDFQIVLPGKTIAGKGALSRAGLEKYGKKPLIVTGKHTAKSQAAIVPRHGTLRAGDLRRAPRSLSLPRRTALHGGIPRMRRKYAELRRTCFFMLRHSARLTIPA